MPGLWGAAGETLPGEAGTLRGMPFRAENGQEPPRLSGDESMAAGEPDQKRTEGSMSYDADPDGGAVWAAALVLLCVVTAAGLLLWAVL